mgnify:CR=1 FL=1
MNIETKFIEAVLNKDAALAEEILRTCGNSMELIRVIVVNGLHDSLVELVDLFSAKGLAVSTLVMVNRFVK